MSSRVINELTFDGDQHEIKELLENVKATTVGTIDFRNVIPFPPCVFQGNLGTDEEAATGNRNWEKWNLRHWGVKKNAGNGYKSPVGAIVFDTDYAAPLLVTKELSWLYKDIRITHRWASEYYGCNCGEAVFCNGELLNAENFESVSEEEAKNFAFDLWNNKVN